jgi:hypothetical protein
MITPIEIAPNSGPGMVKSVRVAQNAAKDILFKLTDARGATQDLTGSTVILKAIDLDDTGAPLFQLTGALQPTQGMVLFKATPVQTKRSGLFRAEVGRFPYKGVTAGTVTSGGSGYTTAAATITGDGTGATATVQLSGGAVVGIEITSTGQDYTTATINITGNGIGAAATAVLSDILTDVWQVLFLIEPSVYSNQGMTGPITIADVRLACLDLNNATDGTPFSNLLDDFESSDAEIASAIRRAVALWNDTPPIMVMYDTYSFPFREMWLKGTVAILLKACAIRYMRNNLSYQGGGIAVNDQQKSAEYANMANEMMQEYLNWARTVKVAQNMSVCWSSGI